MFMQPCRKCIYMHNIVAVTAFTYGNCAYVAIASVNVTVVD